MPTPSKSSSSWSVDDNDKLVSLFQPGDIILECTTAKIRRTINLEYQRIVARIRKPLYTHVMICVNVGVLFDANIGVPVRASNAISTLNDTAHISKLCVLRYHDTSIDAWSKIQKAAAYHVGKTYNYLIPFRSARRFFRKFTGVESTAFCSELVASILAPLGRLPERFSTADSVMPGTFQSLPSEKPPSGWSDVTTEVKTNWNKIVEAGLVKKMENQCKINLETFELLRQSDQFFADTTKTSASTYAGLMEALSIMSSADADEYVRKRVQHLLGVNWKIDRDLKAKKGKNRFRKFRKK
jgi:hypothetical protein